MRKPSKEMAERWISVYMIALFSMIGAATAVWLIGGIISIWVGTDGIGFKILLTGFALQASLCCLFAISVAVCTGILETFYK